MRYFIKLAFNGLPFVGWQIQPNGDSVQSVLQNALSLLVKESISLTGCGRTDSGVHASMFYAHFDIENSFTEEQWNQLTFKLNAFLPKEIVIYKIFKVSEDLHARFSAIDRTYKYYIDISKDPFRYQMAYRVFDSLDIEAMNLAANWLLQVQDFTSFSKLHTQVNNNNCTVTSAKWQMIDDQLVFEIRANRFLRNMVRAIVGTLLLVGKGSITIEQFKEIISAKNRSKAGISVPAHALFLEKIRYHEINDQ